MTTHVDEVVDGIVLAPHSSLNLDGTFNGELISGGSSIALLSNAIVNSAVPEPAALSLLGLPAIGLLLRKRRMA